MKRLLTILFFLLPTLSYGQSYTSQNAKAIKQFEKGQTALYQGKGDEAVHCFEQALQIDPDFVEAHLMLAEWMLDTKKESQAKQHYYAAVGINPSFFTQAWMQLGELELNEGRYDKAKENYTQFLKLDKKNPDLHSKAKHGLACADFRANALAHPVDFRPENLGAAINSPDDEYLPALTVDGQTLIFTRRFPKKSTSTVTTPEEEDFYVSTYEDGHWTKASRMAEPVNSTDNEGAQCISQDGRIMFFTACGRNDGAGRCDLYMCTRKNDKWSVPRNVGSPINSGSWESQPSFSIDGRTLYFVSDRKGGYGGMDIWKSVYGKDGWGKPENLGPEINTDGDEMCPFIHYDDQTLYFASNGHVGMGGMDLFCSKKQEDGSWGKPLNLGYPINTAGNESNLIVSADARTAYYSSDREGGFGKQDLYKFVLPREASPLITFCMKGRVYDKKTGTSLSAQINIIDIKTGNVVATTNSDGTTGRYLVSLPTMHEYAINVSAKNYLFYSRNYNLSIDVGEEWKWGADTVNIPLSRIESGERIALHNVFFEVDRYELLDESQIELDKVVEMLNNNPSVRVELGGHTDNVGSPAANQTLSEQRAKAVYNYLVSKGIAANRLSYKGYGETQPVADNATPEGRQMNRRTEMKVM